GIHASIQAAIDDASPGDTLHVGAGVYREQLAMAGKALTLSGATDARGDPLVKLLPPDWMQLVSAAGDARRQVLIDLSSHPAALQREAAAARPLPAATERQASLRMSLDAGRTGDLALVESDGELADQRVLDLLDSYADLALPVRHFGKDGRQKGAYGRVQEAIDVAADGDRIEIAQGSFGGDLSITRPLTLLGANAGRPGHSSHRGLESVVLGDVDVRCGPGEV